MDSVPVIIRIVLCSKCHLPFAAVDEADKVCPVCRGKK